MLTKTDLNQIREIFREEQRAEIGNLKLSLKAEMKLMRMEIQNEIRDLEERVKNIEIKIDKIIDFFDREHLNLLSRVERLEHHLNLPQN